MVGNLKKITVFFKRMEFTHGGKVACQSLLRDFHGRSLRKSFFEEEKGKGEGR